MSDVNTPPRTRIADAVRIALPRIIEIDHSVGAIVQELLDEYESTRGQGIRMEAVIKSIIKYGAISKEAESELVRLMEEGVCGA